MPGHTGGHKSNSHSASVGPAGGASSGGNYGGNSTGGTSANDMSGAGANNNNYQDRIQNIASGIQPGYRPTDSRPHGLAPEEAYRQGKITKDQMHQAMNNPGIDTSGNYQEKIGFWDQVKNVASEYIESGGLIGNVVKLGGKVLSKLGEYSSDLQKKAMTYSLNQKVKAKMKTLDLNNPNSMNNSVVADLHKDLADIQKGEFTQKDFNEKYGSPEISVGGNGDGNRDAMNMIAPIAPHIVGGTTQQDSIAAKWYANLGNNNNNNAFGFSFQKEYAAAKQKQQGILGTSSSVGQLAVSNSPFYNFLKERNLDKGIL